MVKEWYPRRTETLVVLRGTQIDVVLAQGQSLAKMYYVPVQRNTAQFSIVSPENDNDLTLQVRHVYALGAYKRELVPATTIRNGPYTGETMEAYTVKVAPGANQLEVEVTSDSEIHGDFAVLWYDQHDAGILPPYEHYDAKTGTATDTWGADITLAAKCHRLDVFVWDNPLLVKAGIGGTAGDEITVPANSVYSMDVMCEFVAVKNAEVGKAAKYQIVGWY